MGDTSGSIETREGSLDGEEREMPGEGVLGWVRVGACGQLICAGKPYSTGLPGSTVRSLLPVWAGNHTRQACPGPAQQAFAGYGGRSRRTRRSCCLKAGFGQSRDTQKAVVAKVAQDGPEKHETIAVHRMRQKRPVVAGDMSSKGGSLQRASSGWREGKSGVVT
jgi:hypothetical protein